MINFFSAMLLNVFKMFLAKNSLKSFAVKAGIAATAVYYIGEQGVWRNSDETRNTADRLKAAVSPYVDEVKAQIPVELPEIPHTENIVQTAQEYWNKGVRATFAFLVKSPEYFRGYSKKGYDALLENEEVKNFVNSFTGSSKPVSDTIANKK